MFGYITPDKPELKMWEYEVFQAYYCGVCKAIAKQAGHLGRVILSYDTAFLALLLDSLQPEPIQGARKRCFVHPVKKRLMITGNAAVEYASDINILLAYYNLRDKWQDEKNLVGPAGMLVLRKGFNRVKKKYPQLAQDIHNELVSLQKLEQQKCEQIDEASEPFAGIMKSVFGFYAKDTAAKEALEWIGFNLGKWVYLLDAYDDIEDNIKSGSYNPLLTQFQYEKKEDIQSFKNRIREKTEFILVYSLSEMEKAFSLLELQKNQGILENIVYQGLLVRTRSVLKIGAGCHEKSI
ncbi:MAG: hypothetical protein GX115_05460 [Ruminiclostridium sp.]|nr:hypothetical protein [Ruminiclostridium sp.]